MEIWWLKNWCLVPVLVVTLKKVQTSSILEIKEAKDTTIGFIRLIQNRDEIRTTHNFYNGYFGLGILLFVELKDKFSFNFTGVWGKTTDNFDSRSTVISNTLYIRPQDNRVIQYGFTDFYMVRALLEEKVSKLNIIIGVDIRGVGVFLPQVAPFAGFKIDIASIFK